MRFCEYMYILQAMQFCKYPDFKCKYQGAQYIMESQFGYEKVKGVVTFCELNKISSELEKMLEE
ncbi:hypothetical protein KY346_04935 [Candidatus Woesearchaeota archaeon]|nr:hypothetical protein [Candidatus Woesearchaeota archaeon]